VEQELKDYLKEFGKVTDQIIELKQNGLVLESVLALQDLLLEEIEHKIDSKKCFSEDVMTVNILQGGISNGNET
jgi:hypothetical protein